MRECFRGVHVGRYNVGNGKFGRIMSATTNLRMTADQFIAWAMEQPEGKRYELVAGEVFAMSPERVGHARGKLRFATRLAAAIEAGGLSCEAFGDGLAVRVDADTVYEPDAMVRCGTPLDDDARPR